ncbi:sulfotransferase domain-containing protein [Salinibacter ruber]|uniref:sulfotransferase domain-containing protein n=1 Tax=Salinibacter ruber TaxID=146919 RepID=UPI000E5745E6|nr:sulfotransferase domain-containing protein [Salinibacter ruber]
MGFAYEKNMGECDCLIRYEDMVRDDVRSILDALERLETDVEREVVEEAAELFSFENLTKGRQRGDEDRSSHFRKGRSKDWKNWFDDRHLSVFKEAGGFEVLQRAGYDVRDESQSA